MSERKRVLIIVYYWPPSGGSGVQRWVKFVKYLREFGWEPVIYTPSNPERPVLDLSLEKDIPEDITLVNTKIWEPYSFYKKIVGINKKEELGSGLMKSGKEKSLLQDLSIWIRGNLFIPDARKYWIKPSISFLNKYLIKNPVDAIISTGPPHSMHMIALKVAQKSNTPWLADFRDPWTNIDFFQDLKLSNYATKKHHQLEKKVLDAANKVVVISPTMKKEFEEITSTEIQVITNGFDTSDFKEYKYSPNSRCVVSHIGMMTPSRNPQILWEALSELKEEHIDFSSKFCLKLIGKVDFSIKEEIENHNLLELVELVDYVPHEEIVAIQQQSEVLLLIVNNTPNASLILTGKLFEYLAARRPIVCISPVPGDVKSVISESDSGNLFLYNEKDLLKKEFVRLFENWKKGIDSYSGLSSEKYSRKNLTKEMANQLNSLVK